MKLENLAIIFHFFKNKAMKNQKKSQKILFTKKAVILGLIAGTIGFGAWQYFHKSISHKPISIEPMVKKEAKNFSEQIDKTANWKTYRNEKYGFEIKYPKDLELRENDDVDFDLYLNDKIFMDITNPEIENHIRLYTVEGSEKKILIGGQEGIQFKIKSMKDGSLIQQTLIKRGDKLYLFFGEGEIFDKTIESFKFFK